MSSVLPRSEFASTSLNTKLARGALLVGFMLLVVPTVMDLARQVWNTDEQGHGPLIAAVTLWLMWRSRQQVLDAPYQPANLVGGVLFLLGIMAYALGRSQQIIQGEVVGICMAAIAMVLLLRWPQALRVWAFPFFFLIFLVPLPGVLVQALTIPLKTAVSYVAEVIMYHLGYPVGRSGVILTVGQYQLLVADACAGLNSIFTLEALGLLYANLMGYTSKLRNVLLAYDVQEIVLGGGVTRAGDRYLQPILREWERQRKTSAFARTMLTPAKLRIADPARNMGAWGAVALADSGFERR